MGFKQFLLKESYNIGIYDDSDLDKIEDTVLRDVAKAILKKIKKTPEYIKSAKSSHVLSYQASNENRKGSFKLNREYEIYKKDLEGIVKQSLNVGDGSVGRKNKLPSEFQNATEFLETAACYGFFMKSSGKFTTPPSEVITVNTDELEGAVKDEFMQIAESSFLFKKSAKITKVDIIHKDINTYYKLLKKFEGITGESKENTADIVIIVKGTKDDLYKALGNTKLPSSYNSKTGLVTVGKVQFYQVSLKKGETEARLGRLTTYFRNRYEIPSASDVLSLDEGLMDMFRVVKDYTVTKLVALKDKLFSYMGFLAKTFNPKSMESKLNKLAGNQEKILYEKKNDESLNGILSATNRRIDKLVSLNGNKGISVVLDDRITKISENQKETIVNLIKANNISVYFLLEILNDVSQYGNGSEYIRELITVMRKGATNLPVVILYGNGSHSVLDKENEPENQTVIDPVICRITPDKTKTYYIVKLYILKEFDSQVLEDSKYIFIQFNNAGGNTLGFKIEGNSIKTYKSII